jgi:phosphohistidine phosphatase
MKTLILTRHAKSDWSNLYQADFERELNERGLKDSPMMGLRLQKREIHVDKIVSSPATRAKQTAELIANSLAINVSEIQWIDRLYHAPPHIIQDVIHEIEDKNNCIMIVCHNNGITDFANSLSGIVTENIPTCGMVAFEIETNSWSEFASAKKRLLFYDFPKQNF